MPPVLPTAFALLTAAAGWFYLFYSRAARNLAGVEGAADNRARVLLRRAGGCCMIALAVCFFMGSTTFTPAEEHPAGFVASWFAVLLLLGTTIVLALIDVRLTVRLRRRARGRIPGGAADDRR
jgi:hypothetical protein